MEKVLFVCLGNICRSPMAEAVFREKVKKAQLTNAIEVCSAATSGWEVGSAPHSGTQRILRKYNIPMEGLVSKKIQADDFATYDWVIGMDQQNIDDLKQAAPEKYHYKIQRLLSIVPEMKETNVPDPYYTGDFEYTYKLIEAGCKAWLQKIMNNRENESALEN